MLEESAAATTTEDTLRIVDKRILDGWTVDAAEKQRTPEEERALAQFYEDNFMPLWQQKPTEDKLLDTWVSAILAMDDTAKAKKDVRFSPEGNPARSSGSAISLDGSPGKLLNISGSLKAPKQRRKTNFIKKSPQSVRGVRTMRGLEFLNRLQNKPRRHGSKRDMGSGIFLPENFPFGLTPVPISTRANFFEADESLPSGSTEAR